MCVCDLSIFVFAKHTTKCQAIRRALTRENKNGNMVKCRRMIEKISEVEQSAHKHDSPKHRNIVVIVRHSPTSKCRNWFIFFFETISYLLLITIDSLNSLSVVQFSVACCILFLYIYKHYTCGLMVTRMRNSNTKSVRNNFHQPITDTHLCYTPWILFNRTPIKTGPQCISSNIDTQKKRF